MIATVALAYVSILLISRWYPIQRGRKEKWFYDKSTIVQLMLEQAESSAHLAPRILNTGLVIFSTKTARMRKFGGRLENYCKV
jgi:hypothetical protein